MPACKPWCPLVKFQLKKIATETPWILKKEHILDEEWPAVGGKPRDSALHIVDEKFVSARLDIKHDDDLQKADLQKADLKEADLEKADLKEADLQKADLKEADLQKVDLQADLQESDSQKADSRKATELSETDLDYHRYPSEISGKTADSADAATDTTREYPSKSQSTMVSKTKTEASATQWSVIGEEDHDASMETDVVEQATRYSEDSASRISERERMERIKKIDKPSSKLHAADEREEPAVSQDECDPFCSRYISRSSDYFEDICTCTFSCVVRCLVVDSFIRSLLTSVALFALGLKLSSELDAWYLPIQFR